MPRPLLTVRAFVHWIDSDTMDLTVIGRSAMRGDTITVPRVYESEIGDRVTLTLTRTPTRSRTNARPYRR